MYKFGQKKNPHLSRERKLRAKLYLFGADSIPIIVYRKIKKNQENQMFLVDNWIKCCDIHIYYAKIIEKNK